MRKLDTVLLVVVATFLTAVTIEWSVIAAPAKGPQEAPRTKSVWDGVYTPTQAARGSEQYRVNCSQCHGDDGRDPRRSLVGSNFWQHWGENNLSSLFTFIRSAMPRSAPQSLSDDVYLDIVAYILQMNGYPSGSAELTPEHLEGIQVTRKDGPGPIPNFSLVTVVGCLAERSRGLWVLGSSSEAVRTNNPDTSDGKERQLADGVPLGTQTYELVDVYPEPTGHAGHKMEAKGFLNRGATDRLSVTSIRMIDSKCEQ